MAEAEVVAPEGGKKKMIMMVAGGVLLVVAIGGGAYFLGTKHSGGAGKGAPAIEEGAEAGGEAGSEGGGEGGGEEAGGHGGGESGGEGKAAVSNLVAFDEILVNLLDDQEPRYLKAAITLEMSSPGAVAEATARKAQIRDAIILLLSNKTLLELRDMQGKLQLRADLMEKINGILRKGKVKTLYFTDFIVQ